MLPTNHNDVHFPPIREIDLEIKTYLTTCIAITYCNNNIKL